MEKADVMPGPALIPHLWLSLLTPHSRFPSHCLLAGEGTTGTSQRSGGTGTLSWGPLVVALRCAQASGHVVADARGSLPAGTLVQGLGVAGPSAC